MPQKLQSSTPDNLAKYSHMGALLGALQGQHYLVEINGAIVKIIRAEMTQKNEKGPPSFQELGQTYINMSADTAMQDAFRMPAVIPLSGVGD